MDGGLRPPIPALNLGGGGFQMKVMMAIPSYRGLECLPFLDALHNTAVALEEKKISWVVNIVYGHSYVQAARNDLVSTFLKSDCDKLVFLDEDVSWPPEAMLALLASEKPITAAVYPAKTDEISTFPLPVVPICTADGVPMTDGPYVRAVRAMTGFMCIHREVFTKLQEAYPNLAYAVQGKDELLHMFDFFPQGVYDGTWYGEDFAFCRLWEKIGGEIAMMPDFTLGHHGRGKSWFGKLSEYISQLPGGTNYGNPDAEKAVWCVGQDGELIWRN
jgi:hypothetical protein